MKQNMKQDMNKLYGIVALQACNRTGRTKMTYYGATPKGLLDSGNYDLNSLYPSARQKNK